MSVVEIERPRRDVVVLRLTRPEKLNAIDRGLLDGLWSAIAGIREDELGAGVTAVRQPVAIVTRAARGGGRGIALALGGHASTVIGSATASRRRVRRRCAVDHATASVVHRARAHVPAAARARRAARARHRRCR